MTRVRRVGLDDESVLRNLWQLYYHELVLLIPHRIPATGRYTESQLDGYSVSSQQRIAYLIFSGPHLAGFALIERAYGHSEIVQFFIHPFFRRQGVGGEAAFELFDIFEEDWRLFVLEGNEGARSFWHRIISDYTVDYSVEQGEGWGQQGRWFRFSAAARRTA